MTCPSCGSAAPVDARFCPGCGHALVARPDERRVATVIFADLVGFTRLSETADPEQIKNIVDQCFERLAAEVVAYGGQVDKVIGDAIVAIFGAPVAHEDDAERAVRAGLRMQERLDQLCGETGLELRMRVGINTGEVLVGALRAGGDYTAMGDVVNTASRLQTIAAPGQVVVGPATYAATVGAMRYEPLGSLTVKGREEAVDAWHAVAALAPPGSRRARPQTPMVGRDDELIVLRASLTTTVTRRRTHFILVVGEAGVGKTRIAAELGLEGETAYDARVLTGQCIPYGETDAWYPIGAMIAAACSVGLDDSTDIQLAAAHHSVATALHLPPEDPEVRRIADGLVVLMGKPGHSDAVDPSRAREEALRAGLAYLGALAEERPLILVLSDLHWADPALLEFLPRLLQRLTGLPALLLATARAEFAEEWSPPPGRHNVVNVFLDPLGAHDTDALLAALMPDTSESERATLRDRSGGNPFFVEELAAMAKDADGGPNELPATLHGLISARLDRLAGPERAVLEDAAVVGSAGPIALVEVLAETHGADAPAALARLADTGLLDLTGDEFSFRNELTREIAYGTLTKATRAQRHALVAKTMAREGERSGRIEEVMDRLGYHFNLAASLRTELGTGDTMPPEMAREAASFLTRAARRAEHREDWNAASAYASHALTLVDPNEQAERLTLFLARARARSELRETPKAREDLAAANRLAVALDDERSLAAATTILGDVQNKEGDLTTATSTLERAVGQWRTLGDSHGLAEALRSSGMTALFRGHTAVATTNIDEALMLYRSAHDLRGEAWALQNLAWIAFINGEYDKAQKRLEVSASTFAEIGDWGGVSWALGLLAWVRFTQGHMDEARDLAVRMEQESCELGNRWAGAMMNVLLANIGVWSGDPVSGIQQAQSALGIFRDLGDPWGELQAMSPLVIATTQTGRYADAQALIDEVETLGFQVLDENMRGLPAMLRVAIAVMTGDERAQALAREHLGSAEGPLFINDEQRMLRGLAALQDGEVDDALASLEHARSVAIGAGSDAATDVALALALVAAGRIEEALALCTEIEDSLVTYADRFRHGLALVFGLARRGDPSGADRAYAELLATIDTTGSVLDRAVARLAGAALWGSSSRGEAASADALDLLDRTGIRPVGWERLFALLAGPSA